jgi:hypothetical protein
LLCLQQQALPYRGQQRRRPQVTTKFAYAIALLIIRVNCRCFDYATGRTTRYCSPTTGRRKRFFSSPKHRDQLLVPPNYLCTERTTPWRHMGSWGKAPCFTS